MNSIEKFLEDSHQRYVEKLEESKREFEKTTRMFEEYKARVKGYEEVSKCN